MNSKSINELEKIIGRRDKLEKIIKQLEKWGYMGECENLYDLLIGLNDRIYDKLTEGLQEENHKKQSKRLRASGMG